MQCNTVALHTPGAVVAEPTLGIFATFLTWFLNLFSNTLTRKVLVLILLDENEHREIHPKEHGKFCVRTCLRNKQLLGYYNSL